MSNKALKELTQDYTLGDYKNAISFLTSRRQELRAAAKQTRADLKAQLDAVTERRNRKGAEAAEAEETPRRKKKKNRG